MPSALKAYPLHLHALCLCQAHSRLHICRSLAAAGDEEESEDDLLMPAVNLSNRLNPNNVHFDRQLAAQYKRMSKHEKEALWAADRARQHQLRELTELSQMAGLSATELSQLTELTQVNDSFFCYRLPCQLPDAVC